MASYDELQTKRSAAKAADKALRVARDERELEDLMEGNVKDVVLDDRTVLVRIPDAPPNMPGHYVGKIPAGPAYHRFQKSVWTDGTNRGAAEEKSKAMALIATQCRIYPDAEQFQALLAMFPAVGDSCGSEVLAAAAGGAKAEGKE